LRRYNLVDTETFYLLQHLKWQMHEGMAIKNMGVIDTASLTVADNLAQAGAYTRPLLSST